MPNKYLAHPIRLFYQYPARTISCHLSQKSNGSFLGCQRAGSAPCTAPHETAQAQPWAKLMWQHQDGVPYLWEVVLSIWVPMESTVPSYLPTGPAVPAFLWGVTAFGLADSLFPSNSSGERKLPHHHPAQEELSQQLRFSRICFWAVS